MSGRATPEPRLVARTPLAVHLLSLVLAAAALLYIERDQWFFYDEWDFLARRGLHLGAFGILWGHNEHWSTVPILVYRILVHTVGLRSYAPYISLLVLVHLALAHLLWRVMLRSGAEPWTATAIVTVFLVLGAGANNLDWAFQIGFDGSLALGMLALLVADRDGPVSSRDALVVVLLLLSLMSSGIGVTMTVVVSLAAWLGRGRRVALAVSAAPAVVYLAWLASASRAVSMFTPSRTELLSVPDYVWTGLTRTAEGATGLAGAGPILVLGLGTLLLRARTRGPASSRAASADAAAIGAVVFYTITAVGRIHLGIDLAGAPRYVYIAVALILPAAAVAVDGVIRGSRWARGALLLAMTGALVHNVSLLVDDARTWGAVKQGSKTVILASARALATENVIAGPETLPEPVWTADLHLDVLRRMLREGWLPALPVPDPGTQALIGLRLEVTVTSTPVLPPVAAPALEPMGPVTITRLASGCVAARSAGGGARVRLLPGAPGSVRVQADGDGRLSLWYAVRGRPDVEAGPREVPVRAGEPFYVGLGAPDAAPIISLLPGLTRVCGG